MANPTIVTFRGVTKRFISAKEAYVWLLNRFFEAKPTVFTDDSFESLLMPAGTKRLYFAPTPKELFAHNPQLADNPSFYYQLASGWYADINLSNQRKLKNLRTFSKVAALEQGRDWDWQVLP